MSQSIILNSSNIVSNSGNSILEYRFPSSVKFDKNNKIALSNLSLFYSFFNFTQSNNNTSLSYKWIDDITYNIQIESGFYDVPALNSYIQSKLILNKHYMIDSSNQFVYFIEIVENKNKYAVQLNMYIVPTLAEASSLGWTQPSGSTWVLPVSTITPQVIFDSNINTNLGFNKNVFYPLTPSPTTVSFLSNTTPQITRINSIILTCNMLNSAYSVPNNILYTFGFQGAKFGESINIIPPSQTFLNITEGNYSTIKIQFLNGNLEPIEILDPSIVLMLVIS